jgi:hypothetical protein
MHHTVDGHTTGSPDSVGTYHKASLSAIFPIMMSIMNSHTESVVFRITSDVLSLQAVDFISDTEIHENPPRPSPAFSRTNSL